VIIKIKGKNSIGIPSEIVIHGMIYKNPIKRKYKLALFENYCKEFLGKKFQSVY